MDIQDGPSYKERGKQGSGTTARNRGLPGPHGSLQVRTVEIRVAEERPTPTRRSGLPAGPIIPLKPPVVDWAIRNLFEAGGPSALSKKPRLPKYILKTGIILLLLSRKTSRKHSPRGFTGEREASRAICSRSRSGLGVRGLPIGLHMYVERAEMLAPRRRPGDEKVDCLRILFAVRFIVEDQVQLYYFLEIAISERPNGRLNSCSKRR
jgi:hypothetical protein